MGRRVIYKLQDDVDGSDGGGDDDDYGDDADDDAHDDVQAKRPLSGAQP